MSQPKKSKFTLHFLLIIAVLFIPGSTLFAQYGTFNAEEREIKQYPVYDTYVDIIIKYNEGKPFTEVTQELDSLATVSLNNADDLQFLFLKNEVANLYSHQSQFYKAYDVVKNSMERFSASNDTMHIEYFASLRVMRSSLNSIRSLPDNADMKAPAEEDLFQSQFAVLDAIDETGEPLRNTLADYGLMLFRQGKTTAAIQAMYRTRNLSLEADDLASLAVADYSMITNMPESYDLLKTQNKVLKADIELFEAKESSIPVKLYNAYFNTLVGSNYYDYFDDLDSAIVYTEKALSLLESLKYPTHSIKAASHGNLARYYAEKGDTSRLWSNLNKTRHLAETQSMSANNRAFAYVLISEAVLPYDLDSAFSYLTVLDTLTGKKYFDNEITELKAKAHLQANNISRTKSLILSVFDNYEDVEGFQVPFISTDIDYLYQLSLLRLLEKSYLRTYHKSEANCTPAIVKLITRQNSLFQKIVTENVFGYEGTSLSRIYDDFLDRALPYLFELDDKKYYGETIELLLSSKAIHLNNLMAKKKFQSMLENDTTLFSQLLKSSQQIQKLRNKLASTHKSNDKENHQLQTELNSHLIENLILRYEAEEKIKGSDIKVFEDNYALASRTDIQAQLETDEALIEYFVLDDCWGQILVLPDTSLIFYHKGDSLTHKIREEQYAIMTGRETTNLGDILFREINPHLKGVKKLVVIPDDNLNYIPFESMAFNERMLIEDYAISYSYSSSLVHKLRKNRDFTPPKNLLAIAPLFNNDINQNNKLYTSRYWGNKNIEPLPYSKEEVSGIKPVMQNMLDSVNLITGLNATIPNVKKQISRYDIIHFASHGVVNSEYPERSGLFLFADDTLENNTQDNIGLFSLGNFFNMQMDAELLVLSSCNSGKGSYQEGEGVIALPRGGILAGVPRVLASLWKIHDERTKDFMFLFYKHLAEGNTYRQALRLAKLDAIKAGFLTKNWAGFVLIGG
ncbi:MAG: CHAT domain-containing protein [Bacteroidota bacterium]